MTMVPSPSLALVRRTCLPMVAVALIAVLPFLTLPARAQDETADADATVRVLHAAPGAPAVDVLVDGQPLLDGVAYGTASDYATLSSTEHRLQVVPTGETADAAVVDETIDAAPGQASILAVYGLLDEIGGDLYEVDVSEIEPGSARVRLINTSPDAGAIDLLETGGDEWFGGIALGAASDYRDIAAGTYRVDVRGNDDTVLQSAIDLTVDEARVYDVVLVGQAADESLDLVSLITTVSPPCTEVLGLEGSGSDSCLRLIHAAPDAAPFDIYLNDGQLSDALEFGTATEYVAVPSGKGRAMRVAAAGTSPEDAIIDTGLDLDPGQAYEILVTGAENDLALTTTGTDLRPLAGGQARLRVIHAAPDAGAIDLGVEGQDETLFDDIDFRTATNYAVVDAGEYGLEVRPAGEDLTITLPSEATFTEGVVYDLIALGRADDASLELLALTVPVPLQTGDVATPNAAPGDAPLAETVLSETVDDLAPSPTPAS